VRCLLSDFSCILNLSAVVLNGPASLYRMFVSEGCSKAIAWIREAILLTWQFDLILRYPRDLFNVNVNGQQIGRLTTTDRSCYSLLGKSHELACVIAALYCKMYSYSDFADNYLLISLSLYLLISYLFDVLKYIL
jgi:hypothetical protein